MSFDGKPVEPAIAEQNVAIGGTSTQSAAFNTNTRFVRVHTDVLCAVKFGANPTAVATAHRMADESTEWLAVSGGHKVAVITAT